MYTGKLCVGGQCVVRFLDDYRIELKVCANFDVVDGNIVYLLKFIESIL